MENAVNTPTESAAPASETPAQSGDNQNSAQKVPAGQNVPGGSDKAPAQDAGTSQVVQNKSDPELFEVTTNGKTEKLTLQELKTRASMSHAAHQRWEEAAQMKKEADRFKSTLNKDMIGALREQGFTDDQIREKVEAWYMERFIEPETLTPEQRKIREYESKLKRYQEEEQQKLEQQKQQEMEALTTRQREYLTGQIIQALEQSGLPKTPGIAARMAFYMRENLLKGWDAPLDVIVQQVKDERASHWKTEAGSLKGKDLINFLGEEVVDELRRYDREQFRARKQNAIGQVPENDNASYVNGSPKISSTEVKRRIKELSSGKRTY